VLSLAAVSDVLLVGSFLRHSVGWGLTGVMVGTLALLVVPSVASATVVNDGLGPFDSPFEPASVSIVTQTEVHQGLDRAEVGDRTLEAIARRSGTRTLFLTDTSAVAAPYILASGREVLPVGGFTGAIPSPTLRQIRYDIAVGQIRLAVVPVDPPGSDPRMAWIRTHCHLQRIDPPAVVRFGIYECDKASSTGS
jgi:hypothetical protein